MYFYLIYQYDIEFSLLRGINKIIVDTRGHSNKIHFKGTDFFECIDLEIINYHDYNIIKEILKRIRPTHILRINCSDTYLK